MLISAMAAVTENLASADLHLVPRAALPVRARMSTLDHLTEDGSAGTCDRLSRQAPRAAPARTTDRA